MFQKWRNQIKKQFPQRYLAYLYDPSSQLERTALLIREAQEESAKNGPCGLSPPKSRGKRVILTNCIEKW